MTDNEFLITSMLNEWMFNNTSTQKTDGYWMSEKRKYNEMVIKLKIEKY